MDPTSQENKDASVSREIDYDDQELTPRRTLISTDNQETDFSRIENAPYAVLGIMNTTDQRMNLKYMNALEETNRNLAKSLKYMQEQFKFIKNMNVFNESYSRATKLLKNLEYMNALEETNRKLAKSLKYLNFEYMNALEESNRKLAKSLEYMQEHLKYMNAFTEIYSRSTKFLKEQNDLPDISNCSFKKVPFESGERNDLSGICNGSLKDLPFDSGEDFSLDRYQNTSVKVPAFEANQQRRKFYHTILCIDTSKSMKSSKLMTCCCIQQLLREIPEQNTEFEEVISVVCFGKYLRFYEFNPEDHAGHIQFVNNELENHDRSWIGCTPLADACFKCIVLHTRVKDRLRRNTASVTIKGRVVMFTDGKCNSNRVLNNEDEDNTNPLESMQDIYDHLNDLWTRFRTETLPICCIISSYRDTDQNFLVSLAINTNGKVLLRDEISAFSKFIEVEILAARYKNECRGLNWHQVFAYLRIKLGHRECLYLDYATECILRENGESTLNVSNHNFLPRLIRRHPKQGIYGWQQKSQSGWVFFPNEISDEIEKGYSAWQLSKLQTFTIERHTENQEIDVLRFDLTNMTYRVIGNDGKIYIQRIFMGNDWG